MVEAAGSSFFRDALLQLLRRHYPNGFRIDSRIEMEKLRMRWREDHDGEELRAADAEIRAQIDACTVRAGTMVHLVAQDVMDWLKYIVAVYLGRSQVIFYEAFYARHREHLVGAHILNEEILRVCLRRLFPVLTFEEKYFGRRQGPIAAVVHDEILTVWGDAVCRTYDELEEMLYIPRDTLKQVLGQNGEFLWVMEETYTHISRVVLSEAVKVRMQECAAALSAERPSWNIRELPIEDVLAENDALETGTNSALYDAVYVLCLAEDYEKKGNLLTLRTQSAAPEGRSTSALDQMCDFCRVQDACTYEELRAEGESCAARPALVLRAAMETMVRIDAEHFVSDAYVSFDTASTDAAIDAMMAGDYLALCDFVTFVAFPACRQAWNLFLLESYCRRFSRVFTVWALQYNSDGAGVVIRRESPFRTYTDVLADAALRAQIEPEADAVAVFLRDGGYISRARAGRQMNEVVALMKVRG